MYTPLLLTALAGLTLANPFTRTTSVATKTTSTSTSASPSQTCKSRTQYDANFDDLTGVPGVDSPLPTPYDGLDFQGFQLLSIVHTNAAPGVLPYSGNNYAVSGATQMTTGGSSEWTTNYSGSTIKSFTPSSFYYGCSLNTGNGAAATPQACNIAITGFKSGDNTAADVEVASQEFSYNPSSALAVQQMSQGVFSSAFQDVQYVLVQATLPGGSAALAADLLLLIDDVVYTTCSD